MRHLHHRAASREQSPALRAPTPAVPCAPPEASELDVVSLASLRLASLREDALAAAERLRDAEADIDWQQNGAASVLHEMVLAQGALEIVCPPRYSHELGFTVSMVPGQNLKLDALSAPAGKPVPLPMPGAQPSELQLFVAEELAGALRDDLATLRARAECAADERAARDGEGEGAQLNAASRDGEEQDAQLIREAEVAGRRSWLCTEVIERL